VPPSSTDSRGQIGDLRWNSNRSYIKTTSTNWLSAQFSKFEDIYENAIEETLLSRTGQFIPREVPIIFGSGEGNVARATWEGITTSLVRKVKFV
jgi:hypothetical protein